MTFLVDAWTEDEAPNTKGGVDKRTVLRLDPRLAPVKVAVLPLSRNEDLTPKAKALAAELRGAWNVEFDDAGAIGRRYRRQDEIGTPYCVTVDFDTLEDDAVTVRERDTMDQERIPLDEVRAGSPNGWSGADLVTTPARLASALRFAPMHVAARTGTMCRVTHPPSAAALCPDPRHRDRRARSSLGGCGTRAAGEGHRRADGRRSRPERRGAARCDADQARHRAEVRRDRHGGRLRAERQAQHSAPAPGAAFNEGRISDLAATARPGAKASTPYYVKVRRGERRQRPDRTVRDPALRPGRRQHPDPARPASTTSFTKCPSTPLPPRFTKGASTRTCLVYLVPHGASWSGSATGR